MAIPDTTRRQFSLSMAALASAAVLAKGLNAADTSGGWPSWRGPSRDGVSAATGWPSSLDGLTKQWSMTLEDSYSGPIVSGGRVFTTETVGKQDETLIAVDVASGEVAWKAEWAGAMSVPFFAKSNGDWIRSTPATDGERVLVGGIRDVTACFDAASGEELWRIDFVEDMGKELPPFGFVCSPLIDGEFFYTQSGSAVRKISLITGEPVWETLPDDGGMSGGAFSSPIIATLHGVRQLVVQTRTTLGGVDLETGKVLWQRDIASFRGMNILTPTVWNDSVFTSCYGGKAQLIKLDPANVSDKGWETQVAWESKAEAYMSSPVVVDDHIYMHLKNNRFSCIDLATGEEKWRTTPFGKYWSMATNGKSILALDEIGELLLIKPNTAEFELVERKKVSEEPSWAHIAISENQLFIRRQRGLDAYTWA